jgi:hypothetical protein
MKKAWSAILIPALALVLAGVGSPVLTGCSDKVCTTEEETACTTTYTTCVNTAAAAGDSEGGKKCGDSYCSCFDACGSTCDRSKLGL